MVDPFDIQRQKDRASSDMVDDAMDKLEESRELSREHRERLQALDHEHFFDPVEQQVLRRTEALYSTISHRRDGRREAAAGVDAILSGPGYKAVGQGLYWNRQERSLYVKNGDHYVLYTRDRRKAAAPSGNDHAL